MKELKLPAGCVWPPRLTALPACAVEIFCNCSFVRWPRQNTSALTATVDHAYLIHYRRNVRRGAFQRDQMRALGLDVSMVTGYDREDIDRHNRACLLTTSRQHDLKISRFRTRMHAPEEASALSASIKLYAALFDMLSKGFQSTLVFEDDALIRWQHVPLLANVLRWMVEGAPITTAMRSNPAPDARRPALGSSVAGHGGVGEASRVRPRRHDDSSVSSRISAVYFGSYTQDGTDLMPVGLSPRNRCINATSGHKECYHRDILPAIGVALTARAAAHIVSHVPILGHIDMLLSALVVPSCPCRPEQGEGCYILKPYVAVPGALQTEESIKGRWNAGGDEREREGHWPRRLMA